jgi:T5SS/PEP-CTERM-associated repeat protein
MTTSNSNSFRETPSSRLGLLLALAAGTCASLAVPATAAVLNWNLLGVGSAGTAANWNPAQVPVAADQLRFDLNGLYTVNFSAAVNASTSWTVIEGTMSAAITGTHTTASNVTVGTLGGVTPRLTLTAGTLLANGNVVCGTGAGANGDLRVRNGTTRLATATTGDFFLIGSTATGSVSIEAGGLADAPGGAIIANNPGTTGTLTVTGFDNSPSRSSTFNFGSTLSVGSQSTGTLNVLAGGQVSGTAAIVVGRNPAAVGTVNVGGFGLTNSTLRTTTDLLIANSSGTAGNGTVTVNADGIVEIGDLTTIGDPDGGTGNLTINGTGSFTTRSLTLIPGSGSLTLNDGTLNVNGGTFNNGGGPFVIPGAVGQPALTLSDGADTTFAAANNSLPALTVGTTSNAVYRLINPGTTTTINTGGITLGSGGSGFGSLVVDQGASLTAPAAATVNVGLNGRGIWIHGAGASSSTGDINIAANAGSLGDVQINGSSTLNVTGEVAVGGTGTTPGTAGGDGELRIDGTNAIVNVTSNAAPAVRVFSTGTLNVIDAGQLRVIGTGSVVVQGALTLDGFISCNGFTLSSPVVASLARSITSTSGVTINPGSTANLTGNLAIAPGSNLSCSGTLNVGNHTLDVTNGTLRVSGDLTVGTSGRIRPTAISTSVINAGGELAGDGVFQGNIDNSGTITATGDGLRFESGIIRGVGQGMSGSEFSFNFNAEFEGSGVINADVAGDSTSLLDLTDDLTIGRTTSANGIRFNGTARVNNHVLTLRDADQIGLPGTLDLGTSSRVDINNAGNSIFVPPNGQIIGSGLIQFNPFVGARTGSNAGIISPGQGSGVGNIRVSCSSFRHDADLIIDVNSPTSADVFTVNGAVVLAPGSRVNFNLGFVPNAPFRRTFLNSTSRSGLFSIATFPPVPLGRMRIDYTPTGADLVYCAADYNGDLTVDFFDYLDFVADFDSESPFADFNHDGTVDFFDYLDFVAQFDAGCE